MEIRGSVSGYYDVNRGDGARLDIMEQYLGIIITGDFTIQNQQNQMPVRHSSWHHRAPRHLYTKTLFMRCFHGQQRNARFRPSVRHYLADTVCQLKHVGHMIDTTPFFKFLMYFQQEMGWKVKLYLNGWEKGGSLWLIVVGLCWDYVKMCIAPSWHGCFTLLLCIK